jgi:predicted Rossmann-fold nucleotide-binding protein
MSPSRGPSYDGGMHEMPGGEAELFRRKKAIIAVFGPSQGEKAMAVKTISTEIGYAIAETNQILLTGGSGCRDKGVKGMAICGALLVRPVAALWIGVTQKPSEVKWVPVPEGIAGVIRTDLGDGRNCLEAHLCDGAIAIAGAAGTDSEVIFTMTLGKPVVLVGDEWRSERNMAPETLQQCWLTKVAEARGKMGPAASRKICRELLHRAEKALGEPTPTWLPSPTDERAQKSTGQVAAESILQSLEGPGGPQRPGEFPADLKHDNKAYETVRNEYLDWLGANAG